MKKRRVGMAVMVVLGILVFSAIAGIMMGVSRGVEDLAVEIDSKHVDAILASADVEDKSIVSVPVLYYEQTKDECVNLYDQSLTSLVEARQFEWSECGYYNRVLETEMAEPFLDGDYLPIARGGKMLANRGVKGGEFGRWFHEVEGKSKVVASMLDLEYDSTLVNFSYKDNNFYPVGEGSLFTMNLGLPIEITGEDEGGFVITADDDTWVYVDGKLVLDMGGIHGKMTGRLSIHEDGEIYSGTGRESLAYAGVKLNRGEVTVIRIFHANRDSADSVFELSLNNALLKVTDATLAKNDGGMTVAYNPDDPSYAVPLGESSTTRGDKSRMIVTSVAVQASVVGVLVVVAVVIGFGIVRYVRRGQGE